MRRLPMLLLLLVPFQDVNDPVTTPERARRATVVEQIVVTPGQPGALRPMPRQIQINQNIVVNGFQVQVNNGKQLTLELKQVPASADDVEEDRPVIPQARPVQIDQYALSSVNFDRWVFDGELNEAERRDRLNSALAGKIRLAKAAGAIDPELEEKLRLAGRGDIKRYLDRVEAARARFEAARQDFNAGRVVLGQVEPLSAEYQAGPFGPGSVFDKTLSKIRGGKDKPPQGRNY